MREYFNGSVQFYGVTLDLCGRQTSTWKGTNTGSWTGDNGTLQEEATLNTGHRIARTWMFTFIDKHHFVGSVPDILSEVEGF